MPDVEMQRPARSTGRVPTRSSRETGVSREGSQGSAVLRLAAGGAAAYAVSRYTFDRKVLLADRKKIETRMKQRDPPPLVYEVTDRHANVQFIRLTDLRQPEVPACVD